MVLPPDRASVADHPGLTSPASLVGAGPGSSSGMKPGTGGSFLRTIRAGAKRIYLRGAKPTGDARQRAWSAPSTLRTSRRSWDAAPGAPVSVQPPARAAASRQASRSSKARATSSAVKAKKRAATASAPASA